MLTLEGMQLGNYDVVRRIRAGGMGAVYEGRQRSAFGRRVAIKVILGSYATDREMRRRFEIIDEVLRGETIFDGIVIGQNDSRIAANLKSAVADINLSRFGNHLYVWRLAARRGRAQGKRAHNHRAQHESSC